MELNQQSFNDLELLFGKIFANYPHKDQLNLAYEFSKNAHGSQLREDGTDTPYFVHLIRVTITLYSEFGETDLETLQAALLHDVVEDTTVTLSDINDKFGATVADYVKQLTRVKVPNETVEQKVLSKKLYYQQLMNAPLQIKKIKVIDQLDSTRDYKHLKSSSPIYPKLPRWMAEIQNERIPLARTVDAKYTDALQKEYDLLVNQMGIKPAYDNYQM